MPVISIITPLASDETAWQELAPQLLQQQVFHQQAEWLIISFNPSQLADIDTWFEQQDMPADNIHLIQGGDGRASQMNLAADLCQGDYLWFLHADSGLPDKALDTLLAISQGNTKPALWFFKLDFHPDGPANMWLTRLGVMFRSLILRIPFGDQGFFISKQGFFKAGKFNEQASYGEDHLFVWQCRHQHIPLHCTGMSLKTSARKYRDQGWRQTTKKHLYLTWKQAWPQIRQLLAKPFSRQLQP